MKSNKITTRFALPVIALAGVVGLGSAGGCQNDAQAGAGIGAGLGAIAGAVIGHNSGGKTAEGAAIGAAVGAAGGYMVGNESDKQKTRRDPNYRY